MIREQSNTFPQADHWMQHRVSYGETDAMGVVYYAEYLHYFERARSEYIRNFGLSYAEVEKKDIYLPVREAHCRYRHPARYDQLLWLRTGISEWRRASVVFVYELYDASRSKCIATGSTHHACTNGQGRPVAVPAWLKELFS